MTKEIKLLQIRTDLINQDNISIVEWIVMCILNLDYNKVQGKYKVLDSIITRLTKKDRVKYVDLIIKYEENGNKLLEYSKEEKYIKKEEKMVLKRIKII